MPPFDLVLQLVALGLMTGAGYALLALGLTLVFGIMRLINFAHGEFYMLGAFATQILCVQLGMPYLAAVPLAALAIGAVGYAISTVVIAPLTRQHETAMLLATLGLAYVLMEGTQIALSGEPRIIPTPFASSIFLIGPIFFTGQQVLTFVLCLAATGAAAWYVGFTRGGRLMKAVAQNRTGAVVCGINLKAIYNWTFAIGCGLAALAGATLGASSAIYPSIGQHMVIKIFIVLILGGMGSIPGAVAGGLALGLVEALGGGLISVEYRDAFGYILLVLTLLLRPQGFFAAGIK